MIVDASNSTASTQCNSNTDLQSTVAYFYLHIVYLLKILYSFITVYSVQLVVPSGGFVYREGPTGRPDTRAPVQPGPIVLPGRPRTDPERAGRSRSAVLSRIKLGTRKRCYW
jgi:hypothetical protein